MGSECIQHFPNIKDENNIEVSDRIKQDRKLKTKVIRREKFNKMFPNFINKRGKYKSQISNSPYLLNINLKNRFDVSMDNLVKYQTAYLNGKGTDEYLKLISQEFQNLDFLLNKEVPESFEKIKDNKFVCTKEIANWLKSKNKTNVIEQIRKNNSIIYQNIIVNKVKKNKINMLMRSVFLQNS